MRRKKTAILNWAALTAFCFPSRALLKGRGGSPKEEKTMYTINGTDALNGALTRLRADQEAEALRGRKCDSVREEIATLEHEAQGVRERLKAAEARIAMSGAALPDGPLPEEAEAEKAIGRISRNVRILRERLGAFESDLMAAKAVSASARNKVEEEWAAVAARRVQEVRERHEAAIEELKIAYAECRAWATCFRGEPRIQHPHSLPQITSLNRTGVLALDGRIFVAGSGWQTLAAEPMRAITALQAEVNAAVGGRAAAPVSDTEDPEMAAVED